MIPVPVIDALAAFRLTRLVTADVILRGWRDAVVKWGYFNTGSTAGARAVMEATGLDVDKPGGWAAVAMEDECAPKLATLVTCRWCASVWIGMGVVAARRLFPRLWPPLARALAYSAGAALLAGLED